MSLTDLDTDKFDELVADALEHLWDFSYLGTHALTKLQSVKQRAPSNCKSNHIQVGRALNLVLQDAIDTLRLNDNSCGNSRERYYYTILYKEYVESIRNKDIANSLNIGERTLYRYSLKAIQAVSRVVRDWG